MVVFYFFYMNIQLIFLNLQLCKQIKIYLNMKFWESVMCTREITDSSQNKIVKRKLPHVTVALENCRVEKNNTFGEIQNFDPK